MLMVFEGWTLAAMVYGVVLRLGQECGCWGSTIVGMERGVSALLVPAWPDAAGRSVPTPDALPQTQGALESDRQRVDSPGPRIPARSPLRASTAR